MATTQLPVPDDDARKRAEVYFERGKTVAQTENYEYAIEMYIKGLECTPNTLDAVKALRDISLLRKADGGKPMGTFQKVKLPKARDARQKMLNALTLLAYNPGDSERMLAVASASQEGGFDQVTGWIVPLIRAAQGVQH